MEALNEIGEALRPFISQQMRDMLHRPPPPPSERPLAETENLQQVDDHTSAGEYGHCVTVSRVALTAALKHIVRFRKKQGRNEIAVLSYKQGNLIVSMLNVSEGVPAEGVWSDDVMVSGHIIYNCAKVPPLGKTVVVKVSDEKLYIGSAVAPIHL
jgi:hypothetical protein